MSSYSFSQGKPGATEEKKVEDMAGEEAIAPGEKAKTEFKALQAKTFFDGVSTFANSKVLLKLETKDNIMTDKIEYKIDAGAYAAYTAPFNITDEGRHTVTYFATDKLGNKEDEKLFRITIDNTAPDIAVATSRPILKTATKLYGTKTISFSINAKDALSRVDKTEYSVDAKGFVDYVTPFSVLSDGEIELKVKSIDNVANQAEVFSLKAVDENNQEVELKETAVKIFMDNAAPVVEIKADKEFILKDGKNVASNEYKYTVNAADNESGLATVLVRTDGKGDFAPYKGELLFTTNGEHLIEAKALDKMGNVSNVAVLSVFVDVMPPQTLIDTVAEK
jgi:hypothetical protein